MTHSPRLCELIELGVQHKLITLPRLYAPVHGRPREQVQA